MILWALSGFLPTGSGLLVLLLFRLSSASAALNCSVTREPDGAFMHRVSLRPASAGCRTCWEDHNKTVIAHDFNYDPELVQTLTEQFIVVRTCRDYLHYIRDCSGIWEEAHCRVNCSLYLDLDPRPKTGICFGSWCPDNVTSGLTIGVPFITVIMTLILWFVVLKCRRRQSVAFTGSCTYIPVNEQIKIVVNAVPHNSD